MIPRYFSVSRVTAPCHQQRPWGMAAAARPGSCVHDSMWEESQTGSARSAPVFITLTAALQLYDKEQWDLTVNAISWVQKLIVETHY